MPPPVLLYSLKITKERCKMNYANNISYSDVNPFEVVRVVSDKTIEIRQMNAERDPKVKMQFIPGGFSAHCLNQSDQKWFITSDESAPVIRIRLSKKRGWRCKNGSRFVLADAPSKYYDFNF